VKKFLFFAGLVSLVCGWLNPVTVIAVVLLFLICFSRTEAR
jgi:hypothetical protein